MKPIRIFDAQFNLLSGIDKYESAIVIRSSHGTGELTLRINRYMKDAHLLQKGVLLLLGDKLNMVYVIKHREIEPSKAIKEKINKPINDSDI